MWTRLLIWLVILAAVVGVIVIVRHEEKNL